MKRIIYLNIFLTFLSCNTKKNGIRDYQNETLKKFCIDNNSQIIDTMFTDEPPAVLQGVTFQFRDGTLVKLSLKDIPDAYQFNIDMNWKFETIECSKIRSISIDSTNLK